MIARALPFVVALSIGCGHLVLYDDDEPDLGPAPDRGRPVDFGLRDGPFLIDSNPQDGETGVLPTTLLQLVFSEEMNPETGTVQFEPGGYEIPADTGIWLGEADLPFLGGDNRAVLVPLPIPLTGGIEHTATLGCDFTSSAGEELDCQQPTVVAFTTFDAQRPRIRETTPAENDQAVSVTGTDAIRILFDEAMDTTRGELRVGEGAGLALGDPEWTGNEVRFPLNAPLVYDQVYQVIPADFVDRSGNPLDRTAIIGRNETLDFRTGIDRDPPFVSFSQPFEGQDGVNFAIGELRLEFSEPIDTSRPLNNQARLTGGDANEILDGRWSADRRSLTFDVVGRLALRTSYRLDLTVGDYRDDIGNSLDRATYLGDGALDFRVDLDTFGPKVVSSIPAEGAAALGVNVPSIQLTFCEPMDASRTTVVLHDGLNDEVLEGTWIAGDTTLQIDVGGRIRAGRSYRLSLLEFEDASGNPLDVTHPYLGDGVLDFATAPPSGDDCQQPLTAGEASRLSGGGLRWVIPADDFLDSGSTDRCDIDGGAGDVVMEYVKTTDTLADGGRLLSVRVESDSTSDLNFELRAGVCDATLDSASVACQQGLELGGTTLDLPAGTYYLWVAKETGGRFPGATVTIEEPVAWPTGESCRAPYGVSSAGAYVSLSPNVHEFRIRRSAVSVETVDRARFSHGPEEISCAAEHGADAVIEFRKQPKTILQIRAAPDEILTTAADLNMEVSLGCQPGSASFASLACAASIDSTVDLSVPGPGGLVYIWLSSDERDRPFPGATVRITEVDAGDGESCGTALPVTAPRSTVTLSSEERLGVAPCIDRRRDLTWFAYNPTQTLAEVRTDVATPIVLADQATNLPYVCVQDASESALAVVPPGQSLCIGIPSDSGVRELTLGSRPYRGVLGNPVDLEIDRPIGDSGTAIPWTEPAWLASSEDTLFLGLNGNPFVEPGPQVVLADFTRPTPIPSSLADGVTASHIGNAGVTVGPRLFGVEDERVSPRVFELYDGGVSFPRSPTAWDLAPTSYNAPSLALASTGTQLVVATYLDIETRFWRLPTSAPATPFFLGSTTELRNVAGMAADGTFLYVAASRELGASGERVGVWRIPGSLRGQPELLIEMDLDLERPVPLALDDPGDPTILYVRQVAPPAANQVHAVVNPASAEPLYVGPILRLGTSRDLPMAHDPIRRRLYLFESETDASGRIVMVE